MRINKFEEKLIAILVSLGHVYLREHKFHIAAEGEKPRRWRFDVAILPLKIAFEVEGGVWVGGRHVNPIGFTADCEKYNAATKQGWKVYRLVPPMIKEDYIKHLLSE